MYRVGIEHILGFTKVGDTLQFSPRVPNTWSEFSLTYRFGRATYDIVVRNPTAVQRLGSSVTVDGVRVDGQSILLVDDDRRHAVVIEPAAASTIQVT